MFMTITKIMSMNICIVFIVLLISSGCSSRNETPVVEEDSTIVYTPKDSSGISAKITLCRRVSKKTGKRIGAGTVFNIKDKAKVRALVDLINVENQSYPELIFHLDWIGPNDRSFFRKGINVSPEDSVTTIRSAISISPEKRKAGRYTFRVYLFRELIAEKNFNLVSGLSRSE